MSATALARAATQLRKRLMSRICRVRFAQVAGERFPAIA